MNSLLEAIKEACDLGFNVEFKPITTPKAIEMQITKRLFNDKYTRTFSFLRDDLELVTKYEVENRIGATLHRMIHESNNFVNPKEVCQLVTDCVLRDHELNLPLTLGATIRVSIYDGYNA